MNTQQRDMELQQLNKEYTEQSHAIGRKKCNLDSVREARLIGIDDAMHSERRNLLEQIAELRRQQAGLPKDEQKQGLNYFLGDLKPSTPKEQPQQQPASQTQSFDKTDDLPF